MAEKKVSKKEATNQKTGRLKKGYKAKGKGVYVKVTSTKPKRKAAKKTTKRKPRGKKGKVSVLSKVKRAVKKVLI